MASDRTQLTQCHTGEWSRCISAHSLRCTSPFQRTLINVCKSNMIQKHICSIQAKVRSFTLQYINASELQHMPISQSVMLHTAYFHASLQQCRDVNRTWLALIPESFALLSYGISNDYLMWLAQEYDPIVLVQIAFTSQGKQGSWLPWSLFSSQLTCFPCSN